MLAAKHPQTGLPLGSVLAPASLERQHHARGRLQTALEDSAKAFAVFGIVQMIVYRVHVDRQLPLLLQMIERVLEGGIDVIGIKTEAHGDSLGEFTSVERIEAGGVSLAREQRTVQPQGNAIGTPVTGESPARQRLTRVPFALPVVQQAAGGEAVAQAVEQALGEEALLRPEGGGVPLVAIHVVDGDEGRLAAHS